MKKQVVKVSGGQYQFTCIMDTEQEFEYALYEHWRGIGKNGYPVKHRKLIGRYYTLCAVLNELKDRVTL